MRLFFLCLLLLFGSVSSVIAQAVAPFKAGERVIFTGNSITDGGHYHSYIWLYYLTHFPNRRMLFFNAGIGGDVSKQMYERLGSDVFSKNPTVVTLTFGMNDTGYQRYKAKQADSIYDTKVAESLKSFDLIVAELKKHTAVSKVMIASSPYDETSKIKTFPLLKKNNAMLKIAKKQEQTARRYNWAFVDFNRPMTAINQREQQRDSLFTMQDGDRIHPTNDGQMVMAYLFLKAQNLAGQPVAVITIDAPAKAVRKAVNCTITAPQISAKQVTFIYLANALPYPTDTIPSGFGRPGRSQAQGLKLVPFTNEFNQEILRINGLKGQYSLKIDGKPIGTYTADKLEKGINLAEITSTPQYQQALTVMHLNEERWSIERRLREYYWIHYSILKPHHLLFNDGDATVDSLQKYGKKDFFVAATLPTYQKARFKPVRDAWQKEMDLLINEMYAAAKPFPRKFEITLIK